MDDIEAFSKGQFHADCGIIQLHRDGTHPISISGPGHIAQDDARNLTFMVHLGGDAINALINEINRPRQAGTILRVEDYLTFTAQTYNGEVWASTVPGVAIKGMGLGNGGVASGLLSEITSTSEFPGEHKNDFAHLVVRDAIDFPETVFTETQVVRAGLTKSTNATRDSAAFSIGEEKFLLSKKDKCTELQCTLDKGGVEQFRHIRIQEAMQFAFGQLFQPCVIKTSSVAGRKKTFRSVGMREKPARQNPPLQFRGKVFTPEIYDIAMAYYAKIRGYVGKDWHELSSHVYFLIQTGGSAIELQCLAIGVSAEAIAATCFPSLAPVSEDFIEEIDKLLEQLATLGMSEPLGKRTNGALGAMKKPRTADKLRIFVQEQKLDKRLFDSWQKLRNTSAHGAKIEGKDIAQVLASLNDVLYLCYAMILLYCAYAGVRTDYSTVGSPELKPSV